MHVTVNIDIDGDSVDFLWDGEFDVSLPNGAAVSSSGGRDVTFTVGNYVFKTNKNGEFLAIALVEGTVDTRHLGGLIGNTYIHLLFLYFMKKLFFFQIMILTIYKLFWNEIACCVVLWLRLRYFSTILMYAITCLVSLL